MPAGGDGTDKSKKQALDPGPGYLEQSKRPLQSLLFLAPMIIAYEIALASVLGGGGPGTQTVAAHLAILEALSAFGFPPNLALFLGGPLLVVLLLIWHLLRRDPWTANIGTAIGMAVESLALTIPLVAFAIVIAGLAAPTPAAAVPAPAPAPAPAAARTAIVSGSPAAVVPAALAAPATSAASASGSPRTTGAPPPRSPETERGPAAADGGDADAPRGTGTGPVPEAGILTNLAISIGAGLYEELFFRWILIAVIHALLVDLGGLGHRMGTAIAVICSAAAFTLYHDLAAPGGGIDLARAAFFAGAGIYFGAVYAVRGFGIVVGLHATYDIVTVLQGAGVSATG